MDFLVVEDARGTRDALLLRLRANGWSADGVETAEAAEQYLREAAHDPQKMPKGVILDVMLPHVPGGDIDLNAGLELAANWQAQYPDLKSIVITTARQRIDEDTVKKRGLRNVVKVFHKPMPARKFRDELVKIAGEPKL